MRLKTLLLPLIFTLFGVLPSVQAQCEYQLDMFDSFGDGWNGGQLTITAGSTTYTFTLDILNSDGNDSTVYFLVNDGELITLSWTAGAFNSEVSFDLYNTDGALVFSSSNPSNGVIFTGTAVCPPCAQVQNVQIENIWDTRVRIRWQPGIGDATAQGWWVLYGPAGFTPGPGVGDTVYVVTPKVTITGLSKKTNYDFYVIQDCDSTLQSALNGPYSFQTYWTNDVGIAEVQSPVSGCDLGIEKVIVVLKNYGSAPQSLLPFNYSVNGEPAGVPQPQDGFYTGVLGKDSCEVIEFETTYDFSNPGEYIIRVWTQLNNDDDKANDTITYRVVNRFVAPYQQNFEDWEGGWTVDTVASINSSWEWGVPAKAEVPAAGNGDKCWLTNLDGPFNFNERSYLTSPCFDFSEDTEDPVIEFSLYYGIDAFFDGAWLEQSLDGGDTWEKVGALDEGLNWYNTINTFNNLGDVWAGFTNGWVKARHRLFGVAGEGEVRLRFVFSGGSFFAQPGGMGVDGINVYVPFAKDLVGLSVKTDGEGTLCGLANDKIAFTITNFGTQPQAIFQVAYSVNGGAPVVENFNGGILTPDEIFTYIFNTPFNSVDSLLEIKVWTLLNGESVPGNDTVTINVDHRPKPIPFQENFESMQIPDGWSVVTNSGVTNGHNNSSYVLATNLFSGFSTFSYTLPRYGVITAGDSIRFSYRITNWPDGFIPTILSGGSKIELQVSDNCGASFQTIYSINILTHTPSLSYRTIKRDLSQFAGKSIIIRFLGTWGAGDFWFDLDNINILACPPSLDLTATTTPATVGQSNGAATVNVGIGNPPYQYAWSNGATGATATGLPAGDVSVTVTDEQGCSDQLTVTVGSTTSADEIEGLTRLSLQPNPANNAVQLYVTLDRGAEIQAELVNLLGQRLWETPAVRGTSLNETIHVADYPPGLYLLRLTVDGQTVSRKLVKQ